jgi:hypothetical protein
MILLAFIIIARNLQFVIFFSLNDSFKRILKGNDPVLDAHEFEIEIAFLVKIMARIKSVRFVEDELQRATFDLLHLKSSNFIIIKNKPRD